MLSPCRVTTSATSERVMIMNSRRRAGTILAASATALWVLGGAMYFTTPSDAGANIGAAALLTLAMMLSAASLLVLITSLRSNREQNENAWQVIDGRGRLGAALALISIVGFPVFFLLPFFTAADLEWLAWASIASFFLSAPLLITSKSESRA